MSRSCWLIIFCSCLGLAALPSAVAQPATGTSTVILESLPTGTKKSQIALKLETSEYVSSGENYYREGAATQSTVIGVRIQDRSRLFSSLYSNIDIKDEFNTQENWNYFKPKEAYLSAKNHSFGRKLETWSAWEDYWSQALFQPRHSDNRMHPDMVGLTGYFADFKSGTTKFTLAVLPIYIPEFGAHHYVKDNRFYSKNPWFHPPASKADLGGNMADIYYSHSADAGKIVMHPGVAAKVEKDFGGWSARASAAYKPMPQLLLGFRSFDKFVLSDNADYMKVHVEPRVIYQKVAALETEVADVGSWTLGTSTIFESPDRDKESRDDYTNQRIGEAFIAGVTASRPLGTDGPRATRLMLGAFKLWGGDKPDTGYFAGRETLFERRHQYLEAYSAGIRSYYRLGVPFETTGRVIYDSQQNGGTVSLSTSALIRENLRAELTLDFIGLVSEDARVTDGYLSTYRANDRVGVGVSYVY